jgi:glucose/arabinose dehydrogenase
VHPDFAKTKRVYLTYSKAVGEGRTTAVGYARLESDRLVDFKEIFAAEPAQKTSLHFGSRMVFDQRGHLFFSVGDRGSRELAQDLSTHMGKIIRLTEDGKVPSDNPFVGRVGAKPEIWSYGHRNPQGVFFDFTALDQRAWAAGWR